MTDFFALAQANLLTPAILFFVLGLAGSLAGSKLTLPEQVAKALSIYLMLSIGFKGGVAVASHGLDRVLVLSLIAGAVLSAAIPLVAFGALRLAANHLPLADKAAISAHYGSISIVTFVAASQSLQSLGQTFEGFMVAVAAIMETPAILVGLWLANRQRDASASATAGAGIAHEVFLNSSVVVLTGAFLIGIVSGERGLADIAPFIVDPFKGVLCLFLLDMGAVAGRGLRSGWHELTGPLFAFGIIMPYLSAAIALPFGMLAGLSAGGLALLLTLAASASYIAVPAAMRIALPEARPSIYLTLSLGVTFPMNLIVGIPIYSALASMAAGADAGG